MYLSNPYDTEARRKEQGTLNILWNLFYSIPGHKPFQRLIQPGDRIVYSDIRRCAVILSPDEHISGLLETGYIDENVRLPISIELHISTQSFFEAMDTILQILSQGGLSLQQLQYDGSNERTVVARA